MAKEIYPLVIDGETKWIRSGHIHDTEEEARLVASKVARTAAATERGMKVLRDMGLED